MTTGRAGRPVSPRSFRNAVPGPAMLRTAIFGVVLVGTGLLALTLLTDSCGSRRPRMCAVCERAECGNMAFAVETTDGTKAETCCPRCGLHWLATTGKDAETMVATEFRTGRRVPARSAVYVEGSDVSPCSEMRSERMDEGCCAMLAWDRCLPSLLAFASPAAADSFRAEHGGEIRSFGEIERAEATHRAASGRRTPEDTNRP